MSAVLLTAELPGGGRVAFTTRGQGNMSSVGGLGAGEGALNRDALRRTVGALGLGGHWLLTTTD